MLVVPQFLWHKMYANNRLYTTRGGTEMRTRCKDAIECQELNGMEVISQFKGEQITAGTDRLLRGN